MLFKVIDIFMLVNVIMREYPQRIIVSFCQQSKNCLKRIYKINWIDIGAPPLKKTAESILNKKQKG